MVLNGDILEYENMVGEQGTNAAGITEGVEWLIFFLQMMVGPPLLRLNGGEGEMQLRRGMDDLDAPYLTAEQLLEGWNQGSTMVGELAQAGRRAATAAQETLDGMVGWVKEKQKKRKTRNSTGPVYNNTNYTNMSNSTNSTHGGPGALISYKEGLRFATNTTFSTNFFYHARCIPNTYTEGDRNKSRQVGEGQPLYMIMDTGFESSLGIEAPALPLTVNAGNTLDNMEGLCFLIEWPGHRMHEDPDTANAAKTGVYSRWLELTTVLSQTQNIQFADVMLNPQWKKLIVTNTFLRFEFRNFSIYDYRIHIITYTNKRKGLKYSQEFVQWINGIDQDTDGDKLVAYDFYVNGKFTLPPPCKVLTHKTFMMRSAMTTNSRTWAGVDNTQWTYGNFANIGPAQRKIVRMRFKKGFTFKRDNQVSIPTSEDVWLESTAVPEEQMTYCQVIAVPYKPNKMISQLKPQNGYNGSSYFKDFNSSTAENITWIQNWNESYAANVVDSKRVPIPGISCILRKKNYFCLDKDIAV